MSLHAAHFGLNSSSKSAQSSSQDKKGLGQYSFDGFRVFGDGRNEYGRY